MGPRTVLRSPSLLPQRPACTPAVLRRLALWERARSVPHFCRAVPLKHFSLQAGASASFATSEGRVVLAFQHLQVAAI